MILKFALLLICSACFAGNLFAQTLDFYAEQIKNGTTESKRSALFQLRNLQTVEASKIAVSALKDSDEIVRATAIYSVIYLPLDEITQALLPLLQDTSSLVRKETAYALGKTQNQLALKPLLAQFELEKDLEVKSAIVVALGEIGDVSVIEKLVKILRSKPKEEEDFLRRAAARSIGQIAQFQQVKSTYTVTPESLLIEKFNTFNNLKYLNLAENNQSFQNSVSVLLTVLQNPKESDDVRREAAFALGTIGDVKVIENLRANLDAKDYYLAEISKESLAKLLKDSAK